MQVNLGEAGARYPYVAQDVAMLVDCKKLFQMKSLFDGKKTNSLLLTNRYHPNFQTVTTYRQAVKQTDRRVTDRPNGRTDGRTDGGTDIRTGELRDGRMDGRLNERSDGRSD